ncbi:SIS domain-containing protein [Nibricoccus sp. IMCC34717]|uniref:SIS domain-containing protein n=1 Tax=Nibricoccus sp. IMCC34717 TaxID=3034021 RepID=UPI00384D9A77
MKTVSAADTHTWREIAQQPTIWSTVHQTTSGEAAAIAELRSWLSLPGVECILTGAGSSAFIGEMLAPTLQRLTGVTVRPVPTTDLVTHPAAWLNRQKPTVLVSFARSGNSPESVHAAELAERECPGLRHVVVTCNRDGALARRKALRPAVQLVLPEETNDKSLAMTSSVSSQYLACLTLFSRACLKDNRLLVANACDAAARLLTTEVEQLRAFAQQDFTRAVFLGSGPLLGVARESHLKMQELSNGIVVGKHDSFLGFRHGPKAVVNEKTLVVFLLSANRGVARYEDDLVAETGVSMHPLAALAVGSRAAAGCETLRIDGIAGDFTDAYLCLPALVAMQVLAFHKSVHLGLNPDQPSPSGAIHRVVQGVKIYPYED